MQLEGRQAFLCENQKCFLKEFPELLLALDVAQDAGVAVDDGVVEVFQLVALVLGFAIEIVNEIEGLVEKCESFLRVVGLGNFFPLHRRFLAHLVVPRARYLR